MAALSESSSINPVSNGIAKIAERLGFLQPSSFWGPAMFASMLEDPDSYSPTALKSGIEVLQLALTDPDGKTALVVLRRDAQSPILSAQVFRQDGSRLAEEEVAAANADLKAIVISGDTASPSR